MHLIIDQIENILMEVERINNFIIILNEFIEGEALTVSADDEAEEYARRTFFKRLPLFYSLSETSEEKTRNITRELNTVLEKLDKINKDQASERDSLPAPGRKDVLPMETYNIGGQEYPVIKYVPVKDSAGNLISDEEIPLIDLPWVSDYKWQFDCLVDRLEHRC